MLHGQSYAVSAIRPYVGIIQIRYGRGQAPSSQPAAASSHELIYSLFCTHCSSVEARWPPLTPEHGFPSLLSDRGAPLRLPRCRAKFITPSQYKKDDLCGRPIKITYDSYGGIIRIRFKGRRSTFLSACHTSSPVFDYRLIIIQSFQIASIFSSLGREGMV